MFSLHRGKKGGGEGEPNVVTQEETTKKQPSKRIVINV